VFGWSQGHLSSPLSRGIATLQLFAFENAFFKLKALLHTAVDVVTPSCECSSRARRRRAAVATYRAHQDRLRPPGTVSGNTPGIGGRVPM